jgi:hypothetical protein
MTHHTETKTLEIRTIANNTLGGERTHEKPRKSDFIAINRPWAARQD